MINHTHLTQGTLSFVIMLFRIKLLLSALLLLQATGCFNGHLDFDNLEAGTLVGRGQLRSFSSGHSELRGWDYLASRLEKNGLDRQDIKFIFSDRRMPPFSNVSFSLKPRESASIYHHFSNPKHLKLARGFMTKYEKALKEAEKQFGVNKNIIAAILLVETNCGQHLGKALVIERLARVASVAEPYNLETNYRRLKAQDVTITREAVIERAQYLENLFVPEVVALFEVARRRKIDIFKIRGSSAGAFGIPQFLPSSFLRFAMDGNQNGIISLLEPVDAIWSTANYLEQHGWKERLTLHEKHAVIMKYNNSPPYVEAIFRVADKL